MHTPKYPEIISMQLHKLIKSKDTLSRYQGATTHVRY